MSAEAMTGYQNLFSDGRLGVLSSDSVNRYGERFTVGALQQTFEKTGHFGIPTLISHDAHRPIGWTIPLGLFLKGQTVLLVGNSYLARDDAASGALEELYQRYLAFKDREQFDPFKEAFLLAVGKDTFDSSKRIYLETAALSQEGIAKKFFPDVFAKVDDDGLVDFNDLHSFEYIGAGVFKRGNLCLFAHRMFRRSLSLANNTNFFFLDFFANLSQKMIRRKIAIDPDLVGFSPSFKEPMELEYWWGPQYTDDLSKIPSGVTRHQAKESEKLYHQIEFTDFWWQSRKGEHIFEAEEVRSVQTFSSDEEEYGCRYVHSIVNESSGRIEHLDGAIRLYGLDRIVERLDQSIADTRRDLAYKKLWRIDGDIELSTWKSLIHHFYLNNRLVGEYLGQTTVHPLDEVPRVEPDDSAKSIREQSVPYSVTDDTGIVVGICYQEKKEKRVDVAVTTYDSFIDQSGLKKPYVHNMTLEIVKILRKKGLKVRIPGSPWFIKFKDRYYDLSIFEVRDVSTAMEVFSAIKKLSDISAGDPCRATISFSVKYPMAINDAIVSFLGTAKCLSDFCEKILKKSILLPTNDTEVEAFFEAMKTYNQKAPGPYPDVFGVCMKTGVVKCKRKQLEPEFKVSFRIDESTGNLMFQLKVPDEKSTYVDAMKKWGLYPAIAFRIRKYDCLLCGGDYFKCGCTKTEDKAGARISKSEGVGIFWTDKPDP